MIVSKNNIFFEVQDQQNEVFWQGLNQGSWENETFEIFDRYLSKAHSYIDIGAWIGPTVLYGAHLAKSVYAFEPDAVAFAQLKRNLKLNPEINNVKLFPYAVDFSTGTAKFGTETGFGDSMSSFIWSKETKDVPTISLHDVFEENKLTDCNFIKMDIEGGEFFVLPRVKDLLKYYRPTLFLSLHTPWFNDGRAYLQAISDVLSIYKNIYDSKGRKISVADVLDLKGFAVVVASDI